MMGLIMALQIPIMILNMFGGIVAIIWLMVIGNWSAIGMAVILALVSTLVISIVMIPAMLLSVPGVAMVKKGTGVLGHFLLFCSNLYTYALLWFWSLFVFGLFSSYIGPKGAGLIPLMLAAYGAATAPVCYMASKEGDSPGTAIATFSTLVGCMLFMLLLIFGVHVFIANLAFMGVMAIGLFAHLVMTIQVATYDQYFRD